MSPACVAGLWGIPCEGLVTSRGSKVQGTSGCQQLRQHLNFLFIYLFSWLSRVLVAECGVF